MLKEYYLDNVFGKLNLNCAESVLYTAGHAYGMSLGHEDILLASSFGGGMFTGGTCGASSAAIMALGWLFVDKNAHTSAYIRDIVRYYFDEFEKRLGPGDCNSLKPKYRTGEYGCRNVIASALDVLEATVINFSELRVR